MLFNWLDARNKSMILYLRRQGLKMPSDWVCQQFGCKYPLRIQLDADWYGRVRRYMYFGFILLVQLDSVLRIVAPAHIASQHPMAPPVVFVERGPVPLVAGAIIRYHGTV